MVAAKLDTLASLAGVDIGYGMDPGQGLVSEFVLNVGSMNLWLIFQQMYALKTDGMPIY